MKTEADRILCSALKQTDAEQARIAEALIASLDAPMDEDVECAWQIEIKTDSRPRLGWCEKHSVGRGQGRLYQNAKTINTSAIVTRN